MYTLGRKSKGKKAGGGESCDVSRVAKEGIEILTSVSRPPITYLKILTGSRAKT